ncbi:putative WRKY transcription factor 51 [Acorus calamus]|uniref:WRKY transcription factor 51 n=1 Tax=Acorus calamus TaxID=4465 RepID=A0AAV9EEQ0_ACOCL|nr:putative WRKY transcription factor 51 [Acorus calamus]
MNGNADFEPHVDLQNHLSKFKEYLMSDECSSDVFAPPMAQQQPVYLTSSSSSMGWSYTGIHDRLVRKEGNQYGSKIAFRTKSELEIMEDGYKWRKYGKKSVKNSPNPRNYYRCWAKGCHVKKRVERDSEDGRYVITTYDGIHNHMSTKLIYYDPINTLYGNPL